MGQRRGVAQRRRGDAFTGCPVAVGAISLINGGAAGDIPGHRIGAEFQTVDPGLFKQPVGQVPGFIQRHRSAYFIKVTAHGGALTSVRHRPEDGVGHAGFKQTAAAEGRRMVIGVALPVGAVAERAIALVIGGRHFCLVRCQGAGWVNFLPLCGGGGGQQTEAADQGDQDMFHENSHIRGVFFVPLLMISSVGGSVAQAWQKTRKMRRTELGVG